MIYVIGNSHVNFFTGTKPGLVGVWSGPLERFFSHSIGPVIGYNYITSHMEKTLNVLNIVETTGMFNKERDFVLLAVGEVDCRWHLPLKIDKEKLKMEAVVEECIDRFFNAHLKLKELGYNVIGWGGHPSTTSGHDDSYNKPPNSPVYGDCLNRNKITKHWSSYLKVKCDQNNIKFVSIIDHLIDDNGLTKMQYFTDYCHLNTDRLLDYVIKIFNDLELS